MTLNVYFRQPFTETRAEEKAILAESVKLLASLKNKYRLNFLLPLEAYSSENFKEQFEIYANQPFTPNSFRTYRLNKLNEADIFINLRVAMSESSAFEMAYNIFHGNNAPIFFAIWKKAPIKTTLLKDLQYINNVNYTEFDHPLSMASKLEAFIIENITAKEQLEVKELQLAE